METNQLKHSLGMSSSSVCLYTYVSYCALVKTFLLIENIEILPNLKSAVSLEPIYL